jgi:hypothetical protein
VLLAAAAAGAGAWAALAACGAPGAACAWVSGAAAATAGGAVATRCRAARPSGPAHLAVLGFLAAIVTRAGMVPAAWARLRYAAGFRYLNSADRQAVPGVSSVSLRPGRLVAPLLPSEQPEGGGGQWPGTT